MYQSEYVLGPWYHMPTRSIELEDLDDIEADDEEGGYDPEG